MPLVTTPSGYTVSSTLLFVKDFWLPISGLTGLSYIVFRSFSKMAKNAARVGEIEKDIDELKGDVNFIRGKIGAIEKFLKSYFVIGHASTSSSNLLKCKSPLELTAKGQTLLKEINFALLYRQNKDKFLKIARAEKPKFKYEVQDVAFMMMVDLAEDPLLSPVKKYAFDHGKNMIDVTRVCGVYLRDELVKELKLKD